MVAIEKLDNMKAAAVHIEVNVSLFKIRRDCLPDGNLRMQLFHRAPCRITYTLAVDVRGDKQQIQIAALTVHLYNNATDRLAVLHDTISLTAFNGILNRFAGYYFSILFKVIVSTSEFFQCTVIERFLIVPDKLLLIGLLQWKQLNIRHTLPLNVSLPDAADGSVGALIYLTYFFLIGCLITVFSFSGATFLASLRYIS